MSLLSSSSMEQLAQSRKTGWLRTQRCNPCRQVRSGVRGRVTHSETLKLSGLMVDQMALDPGIPDWISTSPNPHQTSQIRWRSRHSLKLNWIKLKSLSEVCVPGKHMSLLIWFGQLITSYELELLFKNFFQFASWMIYKLIWLMLTWLLSCLPWHVCLLLLLLLLFVY